MSEIYGPATRATPQGRLAPATEPAEISAVVGEVQTPARYPGLPSANIVHALDSVDPSTRDAILSYATQDHDVRSSEIANRYKMVRNGQFLAFGLVIAIIACSVGLIVGGFAVAGTVLGSIDLVALATAFLAVANGQKTN